MSDFKTKKYMDMATRVNRGVSAEVPAGSGTVMVHSGFRGEDAVIGEKPYSQGITTKTGNVETTVNVFSHTPDVAVIVETDSRGTPQLSDDKVTIRDLKDPAIAKQIADAVAEISKDGKLTLSEGETGQQLVNNVVKTANDKGVRDANGRG